MFECLKKPVLSLILASMLVNQMGCGSPETRPTSELQNSALGDALGLSKDLQKHIEIIGDIAKGVSTFVGAIGAVDTFLQMIGLIENKEEQILRKLDEINQKLDQLLAATMAGITLDQRRAVALHVGTIKAATATLKLYVRQKSEGKTVNPIILGQMGPQLAALQDAIFTLAEESYSQRVYDPNAVSGDWTAYIQDRAPMENSIVFDHRLAFPAILEGIAIHLLWMAALDSNFHVNGAFKDILLVYANIVRSKADRIRDGVACTPVPDQWHTGYSLLAMGCADIYTGTHNVNSTWLVDENRRQAIVPYTRANVVKRHAISVAIANYQLKEKLGLFGLYQLAERLAAYAVDITTSDKNLKEGVTYWVDTNPRWPGAYYSSQQSPCDADEGPGNANCFLMPLPDAVYGVHYWVDSNPLRPGIYYAKVEGTCPYKGVDAGPDCRLERFNGVMRR